MAEITIGGGHVVLLDDADVVAVSSHRWFLHRSRVTWYVVTKIDGRMVRLHRWLLGATSDQLVDHANRDPLDNRRENLRVATRSQSNHNRAAWGSLGLKGVAYDRTKRKYVARITVDGRRRHLGWFDSPDQAANAYDAAAKRLVGAYAVLNGQAA